MPKSLRFISVMSELGAGTRGASLGFDALRMASLKYDPDFFANRKTQKVKTENNRLFKKSIRKFAHRLDGIVEMYERIEVEVAQAAREGFPFVIAGDHSNAGGTIAGLHRAYPQQRLGVIWIDAHSDLHSPYTTPSGNVHGMPLATALGEDNLANQNNQPDEDTVREWNKLKGPHPRIRPSDLFFIGVRDAEKPELNLMEEHHMPNVKVADLRQRGVADVAQQARGHLKDCDLIYISFDVDSLDPSVSVGTGTPVEEGLNEEEARGLLLNLTEDSRLCGFEVTEINPLLDRGANSMAEAAFRILKPVVEKIESVQKSTHK